MFMRFMQLFMVYRMVLAEQPTPYMDRPVLDTLVGGVPLSSFSFSKAGPEVVRC